MPFTRIFGFSLPLVIVVTFFASVGTAQIPRPLRWLGQGFSDGYHQCNPGPNSDYYNPYTAHNSMLISRNPGMYGMPQHQVQNGPIQAGVPFSVYASPAPVNGSRAFQALPGEAIDNSFVPVKKKETKKINDWVPDSPEKGKDKANDAAAYAPSLQGRVEYGISARTRPINMQSNQVDFSKAGFQTTPQIGEIIEQRVETDANLFNPFDQSK